MGDETIMRPFWQNTWQGVEFKAVGSLSLFKVATSHFYASFYKILSGQVTSYESLDPKWLRSKTALADFIKTALTLAGPTTPRRILSIGAGLAYVESRLISEQLEVDIFEFDDASFFLAKGVFKPTNIICGSPDVLRSKGNTWDAIVVNAVDYVFRDGEFIDFLQQIRRLSPNAPIFISSASYDGEHRSFLSSTLLTLKALCSILIAGRYDEFQLWGYLRTRADYRRIVKLVPEIVYEDGFTEEGIYWIKILPSKLAYKIQESKKKEPLRNTIDAPCLVKP